MHVGGTPRWDDSDFAGASAVLAELTCTQIGEVLGSSCTDAASRAVVLSLPVPRYEIGHLDMAPEEQVAAEAIHAHLTTELGR